MPRFGRFGFRGRGGGTLPPAAPAAPAYTLDPVTLNLGALGVTAGAIAYTDPPAYTLDPITLNLSALGVTAGSLAYTQPGAGESGGNAALGFVLDGTSLDDTLTLSTNGTNPFGTRTNAKTLLVWRADDNSKNANTTLGRIDFNSTSYAGSFDTSNKAPGATQSLHIDMSLGFGPKALHDIDYPGGAYFDTAVYVYLFACKYISPTERYANFVQVLTGNNIAAGDTIVGDTSGVTGTVVTKAVSSPYDNLYLDPTQGSFGTSGYPSGDVTPFSSGEGITATNTGHTATVKTSGTPTNFNYLGVNTKGTRTQSLYTGTPSGGSPDFYGGSGSGVLDGAGGTIHTFRVPYSQVTDNPTYAGRWTGSGLAAQTQSSPLKYWGDLGEEDDGSITNWSTEEKFVLVSTQDDHDGEYKEWVNGWLLHPGTNWQTRSATGGDQITKVLGWHVEHGVGAAWHMYVQYYYIDDQVERVYLADADHVNIDQTANGTVNAIPLPITAWATGEITCKYLPYMPNWTHIVIVLSDQSQYSISRV